MLGLYYIKGPVKYFPISSQRVNILGSAGHMAIVTTTQSCTEA